jgi:aminoglycoside 6'-N-acetyltransferase
MAASHPVLTGPRVVLRPGTPDDVPAQRAIRSEPGVANWWGTVPGEAQLLAEVSGEADDVFFVVEVDGEVAGGIQYGEEDDPDYRHAAIDVYLAQRFQGRGLGSEAVAVLAAHLVDDLGHHRLTIDPALANERAIRSYGRVGFRQVGVMRDYERAPDGTWHDGMLMDLLADELVRAH